MKQGWDRSAVEGGAGGTCLVCKNGENMKKEDKHEDGVFDIDHNVESPISEDVQQVIFSPRDYLAQFYEGDVNPGNRALLRFYARIYEDLAGRSFLEFSGGPTIYSLITAARTASWIHFCDYNDECLNEVNKWLMEDDSAFDWSHFTRYALERKVEAGQMKRISRLDISLFASVFVRFHAAISSRMTRCSVHLWDRME